MVIKSNFNRNVKKGRTLSKNVKNNEFDSQNIIINELLFYDVATPGNKNDYFVKTNCTEKISNSGTTIKRNRNSNSIYVVSRTENSNIWRDRKLFDIPLIIDFEVLEFNNNTYFHVYESDDNYARVNINQNGHWKIDIQNNKINVYVDGTWIKSIKIIFKKPIHVGFQMLNDKSNPYIKYKNFKIFQLH